MSSATDDSDNIGQELKDPSYVGNTMAAFVMQSMGCEVAALNTVQFSMYPDPPTFTANTAAYQYSRQSFRLSSV